MAGDDPQLSELKMLRQAVKEKSHNWGGVLGLGGQEGRSLLFPSDSAFPGQEG